MTWRQRSLAVIADVLASPEAQGKSPEEVRQLVEAAYPFGVRAHYPYKAWRSAVNGAFGPSEKKRKADRQRLEAILRNSGQLPMDGVG